MPSIKPAKNRRIQCSCRAGLRPIRSMAEGMAHPSGGDDIGPGFISVSGETNIWTGDENQSVESAEAAGGNSSSTRWDRRRNSPGTSFDVYTVLPALWITTPDERAVFASI